MKNNTFSKTPLSNVEKEKKAEEFIGFLEKPKIIETVKDRRLEKESMKSFALRVPISLFEDLKEIAAFTGISVNSICLEFLRPNAKKKLKELKDGE